MKKILHVIASPRGEESRTLKVSRVFFDTVKRKYPDCRIDELNVFKEKLPELTVKRVDGKYILLGGKELPEEFKKAWSEITAHIERFMAADICVISTPMWNFSIPYPLKQYIDVIIQPKYLFRYTDKGVEGLAGGKKMIVITSRGGDYSSNSPTHSYDLQEPYLKTVFGFVGLTDITFIKAEPMDASGPDVQAKKINEAISFAKKIAEAL